MKVDRTAPPASFGPYEIVASLGRGGGGEVFRAWDPRLEREVALKILHDRSGADPDRLRRFVSEARAASALNHPNILTVFDAAIDGDTPFIVSEVIDGGTLREELRKGPVPLKRLLDLVTQIADGLTAAHDAGIVHRDVKPENIMVTRSGRVKILDFGLAGSGQAGTRSPESASNETETVTERGLGAGTIPYMSPEQARGAALDFRSDQFSFGLIVFEMMTGRHPFRRSTPAETLHAIINEELPPLSGADAEAPLMLRWISERCLAKISDDRYGATADLHRDLRTLRDRLGEVVTWKVARSAPEGRAVDRRVLVGASLVAALVSGAGLMWAAIEPSPAERPELRFTPFATAAELEGFPAWSPDGQTIAYAAEVDGVLRIHTRGLSSASAAPITALDYDCKYPFWSPDGKRIYYVSLAGDREGIWSVAATGGRPQLVVKNASRGAISKDGTLAFLRDEERAEIVAAASLFLARPAGEPPWSADAVDAVAERFAPLQSVRFVEGALAFSPDGTRLGISGVGSILSPSPSDHGWQFWSVPLRGGQPRRQLRQWPDAAPTVSSFAWLPDSRHVVLGMSSIAPARSHLYAGDLDRDRAWPLTRSADSEYYPSTSPDGQSVVFVKSEPDYDLMEFAVAGRGETALLATARNESDPAWFPGGDSFAYVTDRRGRPEIWERTRDGRLDRSIVTQELFGEDPTIMLTEPVVSPNGQKLAYVRNGYRPIWPLRIWISNVAGGTATPLLPRSQDGIQGSPSWSPDGNWIAFSEYRAGTWMLVKVRVGTDERVELRTNGVANANTRWSPRDDWITWETAEGFLLVSPDGKKERRLYDGQFLVHAWSRHRPEVIGIEETEGLRLSLIALDTETGKARTLRDLGPSPPVNHQVRGLSLSLDGRTLATSTVHLRGDLWLLQNLGWQEWSSRWRRAFWKSPMEIP